MSTPSDRIATYLVERDLPATPDLVYRVAWTSPDDIRFYDGRHAELHGDLPTACQVGASGWTGTHAVWIGLDIDGSGHSGGHSADAVQAVRERLAKLPYVTLRSSKSGQGLHAIIELAQPVECDSESVMQALGAALVQALSDELQFDLAPFVDKAGSNLWLAAKGAKGCRLIQAATEVYVRPLAPLYPRRADTDVLTSVEGEHARLIEWLANHGTHHLHNEHPLYRGHTTDLLAAHAALNLRGEFATRATGKSDAKVNCWMYPLVCGEWLVGTFGSEPDWETSHSGKSYCILNPYTTLADALEQVESEGILTLDDAAEVCSILGIEWTEPDWECDYVEVQESEEAVTFSAACPKKGNLNWKRVSAQKAKLVLPRRGKPKPQNNLPPIRGVYSPDAKGAELRILRHGRWLRESKDTANLILQASGLKSQDASVYLGDLLSTHKALKLVNKPFKPEGPIGHEWNLLGAQLMYEPRPGEHPTWDAIFSHLGQGLDSALDGMTGAGYLRTWVALMFQEPEQRLPMLFFYSEKQNCGKSSLAAALDVLLSRGYVAAKKSLTKEFNGELHGAILCDLDDVDLSKGDAYERLKNIITGERMAYEKKNQDVLMDANTTHWVHTTNHKHFCPVETEDTRIVCVEVAPLDSMIPSMAFKRQLVAEAPAFLYTMMNLPLPEQVDRLYLPVPMTRLKKQIIAERSAPLNDRQQAWLDKLRVSAPFGPTEFKDLPIRADSAKQFSTAWGAIALRLEAEGYECNHTPSIGRNLATWSIAT